MIPRVIHYCWFGNGKMSSVDEECIESWKKLMPDYEIKRWDETNFDIEAYDYAKKAYLAKKWAYVSDCARFVILYNEGGIFLDTDVKAIKKFDTLLKSPCFFGVERPNFSIAPGLIIGAEQKNECIKAIRDLYLSTEFLNPDEIENAPTSPAYATKVMKSFGFVQNNELQKLPHATIYPYDYFAPMDFSNGLIECTENTYSIHLYNFSWASDFTRKWLSRRNLLNRKFGVKRGNALYLIWSFPSRVVDRFKTHGIKNTFKYILNRFKK